MFYLRVPLALALVMALGGCFLNTNSARVTTDYLATRKNVGVISLLTPHANVSYLGTSAMDSRFSTALMTGWDTDALVWELMEPRLRRKGFTVQRLPRNSALEELARTDWRAPGTDSAEAEIYAIGQSAGLDMIVVVQAYVSEDFVTHTNQKIRGFGLQKAWDTDAFVYGTIYVEVYDTSRNFVAGQASGQQVVAAAEGLWSNKFESNKGPRAVSGDQAEQFKAQLKTILSNAIGVAAQEVGL